MQNNLFLQVMVTNVTSLLKTVKTVEDEHTKGTSALESTIEAIGQEMRVCYISEAITNINKNNQNTKHYFVLN